MVKHPAGQVLAGLCISLMTQAAHANAPRFKPAGDDFGALARAVAALVVMAGIAAALVWWARRHGIGRQAAAQKGQQLHVKSSVRIGMKSALHVVEYDGREYMVGLAEQAISICPLPESRGTTEIPPTSIGRSAS